MQRNVKIFLYLSDKGKRYTAQVDLYSLIDILLCPTLYMRSYFLY